jgi:hypothetical protein
VTVGRSGEVTTDLLQACPGKAGGQEAELWSQGRGQGKGEAGVEREEWGRERPLWREPGVGGTGYGVVQSKLSVRELSWWHLRKFPSKTRGLSQLR